MTVPAISVVIPAFNAFATLAQTIASVQAQSCTDWEALIIDDGSTDGTATMVREIQERESRLRLLSVPNRGVSAARNLGVAETHSPLIAFLDADDLWHPDKLRLHLERHACHAALGVSFARVAFLSPEGKPTGLVASHPRHVLRPVDFLCENPTITTSNWVLRREVFAAVGGFVEEMSHSEDLEWLLRAACFGTWQIAPIDRVLTYYRTSTGGLSSSTQKMEQGWLRLISEARGYAPELVERHFFSAQAIQLRYLARRSLRLRDDPTVAADFLLRALRSDWSVLIREPRRSGLTALAVFAQWLMHTCRGWFPSPRRHSRKPGGAQP
jgi:glycosyltransferase involved in cell wall biosynthesis